MKSACKSLVNLFSPQQCRHFLFCWKSWKEKLNQNKAASPQNSFVTWILNWPTREWDSDCDPPTFQSISPHCSYLQPKWFIAWSSSRKQLRVLLAWRVRGSNGSDCTTEMSLWEATRDFENLILNLKTDYSSTLNSSVFLKVRLALKMLLVAVRL